MKNKKAGIKLTTENFIGTIIAIIGLALLIFGAYKLYNSLTTDTETESAKTLLNNIEGKVNALLESNAEKTELTLRGINEKWHLISWNKNSPERPEKCSFSSCICICKSNTGAVLANDCQENGFCRNLNLDEIYTITMKTAAQAPNTKYASNGITLEKKLISLDITKTKTNEKTKINIIYNE